MAHSPDTREKTVEMLGKPRRNAPRLSDFVSANWLPHIRVHNTSWKLDESICKKHIIPTFGSKALTSITEEDVRRWVAGFEKHKCALSTRNRRVQVIRSIFRLAVESCILTESPASAILTKRVKKVRWPTLDSECLTLLLDTLNRSTKREAQAIALLLLTGARKNEILHARWENLFLHEGVLLVPRIGTPPYRTIWLSEEVREIFRTILRRKDSPWIFPGRDIAKPISDIFLFWKELRTELGLETLCIRDLRYIFANWQLRAGMPMSTLKRHMGVAEMRYLNARPHVETKFFRSPELNHLSAN